MQYLIDDDVLDVTRGYPVRTLVVKQRTSAYRNLIEGDPGLALLPSFQHSDSDTVSDICKSRIARNAALQANRIPHEGGRCANCPRRVAQLLGYTMS
jgi:hypothetical protein